MSKISKMKKFIVGIITTLIAILGMSSISNAYYVGQSIIITYDEYANSNNIFCMEHGQALTYDNAYTIISNVKINGRKSTDHNGNTIEDKANAKLAYILHSAKSSYRSTVENAVWNYGHIWMRNVGKRHSGLYEGFASNVEGAYTTDVERRAEDYANNLIKEKSAPQDMTDKSKIQVKSVEKNNKQYIRVGPFKWSFGGTLTEIKAYDQNSKNIDGIIYSEFTGNTEKTVSVGSIKSGDPFYISIPADKGVTKITKLTGKESIDNITANIWFLEANAGYKQNLLLCSTDKGTENINMSFDYNIVLQGNLKVIKVNKNNETVKLQGVGFYVQNKDTKKYVKASGNTTSYVDKRENATEFITDTNGEITIKNLLVGTYVAYETKNPNYGYEIISEGQEKSVTVDKTAELKIPNKQKFVKLSGYVWVDKISGKQSLRNDLYNDGDYDSSDTLLDGITVKLKNRVTGAVVKEAKTANGGAYQFIDVLVDDLDKYYIEFEYDGLTYTNVVPHTDKNNGSKSAENAQTRTNFNNNFTVVEGKTSDTSITRDNAGNEKHTITYNVENHTSSIDKTKSYYEITANTDETGYKIKDHFTYGQEEIKYINLGLYEREMPDLAIMKDLHDVKMTINGKAHVYEYAQRFLNAGEYGDGFNVGVKFGEKYGSMSYSRAVYNEDSIYEAADKSKELKVYVTYQISMKNQSTNLKAKVNSLVDYYDDKYTLAKVGTGVDKGNLTGELTTPTSTKYENTKYNKAIIDTSSIEIGAQEQKDIYVQFELNREAVLNILNSKENLDNVVEINSYSIYDENGKVYAGIDKDSNPGNTIPGNKATYEDDTDSAPGLLLELAEHSREMSGRVFLDSTSNELMTGKVREGSGEYEAGEKGIEGVKVVLTENSGSGRKYEAKTDKDGIFKIPGFIPGDYTLTYTWGDSTYTVQNYKGTIWTQENRSEKQANGTSWYKVNMDKQYSDAMDDYSLRQRIDSGEDIKEMNSTTPEMNIEIEITSTTTTSFDDKFIPEGYNVKNIDFGIVERARQKIDLEKRIKTFKVSLANGQVVADVTVNKDKNGKRTLSEQVNHVNYIEPSATTLPNNGFIRLELDNELIQGAKVEVTYEITATNNSEVEYLSENYYKYGIQEGEVVKISPVQVVDYLDSSWGFETTRNPEWSVKTLDEIKDKVNSIVYEDQYSTIANKTILYTESFNQKLKPTESISKDMYVSKQLANSDEISLNNETEIVKVEKTGGADIRSIPGNYVPGAGHQESDDALAETVIITPNTGANLNFVIPVIVGVTALVILGVGIILIKKKTL